MNALIDLWGLIFLAGLSLFYLLVLAIIPFGARDMKRLFADLNKDGSQK